MPFKKGEGGRPKGSVNKETLTKLEARARFDEKVAARWDEVIDKLIAQFPVYVADQKMGKAADVIEATIKKTPSERIKAIAEMLKNADSTK
jgi:hypothetical protein